MNFDQIYIVFLYFCQSELIKHVMDQDQYKQIMAGKSPKVNFSQTCIFLKGYLKLSLSQQPNNLIKTVINELV